MRARTIKSSVSFSENDARSSAQKRANAIRVPDEHAIERNGGRR